MNKLLINLLANFAPKAIGDYIVTEHSNLVFFDGSEQKMLLGGTIDSATSGHFYIGGLLVQFGKISSTATQIAVNFPIEFADDSVFPWIQEAANDPNQSQVEFESTSATGFIIQRNTGAGSEEYFWFAIGNR